MHCHTGVHPLCDQGFRWDVFQLVKDIKKYHFGMKIWVVHPCTLLLIMDIFILYKFALFSHHIAQYDSPITCFILIGWEVCQWSNISESILISKFLNCMYIVDVLLYHVRVYNNIYLHIHAVTSVVTTCCWIISVLKIIILVVLFLFF